MPPNAPLLVAVPILLLAAGVSAWALYEGRNLMPDTTRNPLTDVAAKVGTGWSALSGVIGALVTYGVLSGAQGEALTAVGAEAQNTVTAFGTLLGGVLPLIAGIVSAFGTAKIGEGHVTPVVAPRDHEGRPLVPGALVRDGGQTRVVGDGDGIGDHRAK